MMLDFKILVKSTKTNSCWEMRTNLCTHWEMFLNKEHNVNVKYSNLPFGWYVSTLNICSLVTHRKPVYKLI